MAFDGAARPRYFDSLTKHAVPLDSRAVAALAHSALDLDIYAWLAQRLHRIPKGKPQTITWQALKSQFGPDYDRLRKFREKFVPALKTVLTAYPSARIEDSRCRPGAVEFPASGSEEAGQHAAPQPPDHRRDRDRNSRHLTRWTNELSTFSWGAFHVHLATLIHVHLGAPTYIPLVRTARFPVVGRQTPGITASEAADHGGADCGRT